MLGAGVELAAGDFSDMASVRRAVKSVHDVFLACSNHPDQVEYETRLIDAAVAAGVERIVKLSALGAQVGSPLGFWDWHGRIELHLRQSAVLAVILRPNFYMSGLLGSAGVVRHTGKLFAPADGARIAMIDPRDVASVAGVMLTTASHKGDTHVLTGPEAITFGRIAEELSAATGRLVEFIDVPDEGARQGLVAAGMPDWLADELIVLFGILRQNVQEQTTDTVGTLTGREPRSFAQFARDHAARFRP
jgi:uncharacterized protein YbjT (DUF2867 family)